MNIQETEKTKKFLKNRLFNKLSLKNNYDNFSGKEKNVESSVRFYIRTEDIGEFPVASLMATIFL